MPAPGDTPSREDAAQVSAVEGFVEEALEYHAAVQAVVLKLVGHPGVRVAHAAERVELHARVYVHVVEVHRSLERHLVAGQALRVVDLVPAGVLHQQIHRRLEGLKLGHLLKHPREHGLAGKHERAR